MPAKAATATAAWPWQVAGEMLKWMADGRPVKPVIPIAVGEKKHSISPAFCQSWCRLYKSDFESEPCAVYKKIRFHHCCRKRIFVQFFRKRSIIPRRDEPLETCDTYP